MRETSSRFGPLTGRRVLYYPALAASATALTRKVSARVHLDNVLKVKV